MYNFHKSSSGSPRRSSSTARSTFILSVSLPSLSALEVTHSGKPLLAHPSSLPFAVLWGFKAPLIPFLPWAESPFQPGRSQLISVPPSDDPATLTHLLWSHPIWSYSYLCHCLTFPLCSFISFDLTPSTPAGSDTELGMETLLTRTRNIFLMRKKEFSFFPQHVSRLPSAVIILER